MKAIRVAAVLCLTAICALAADDPFAAVAQMLTDQHLPANGSAHTPSPPLTLPELEQIALHFNPEIRLARRQLASAEAHIPGASALDDASFMYRAWQVPLPQPWNYNAAMNMFMVGQSFPGPGKRALRSQIASDAASVARAQLEATARNISAQVHKSFYDLLRNADELKLHDEQMAIARQGLEAARIRYSVAKVPQQDVLKAEVAVTRLMEHLLMLEQDTELGHSTLNALLGRDPDSPIAVSGEYVIPAQLPPVTELEQAALTNRPELLARSAAMRQAEDQLRLAKKSYAPDFSANVGYMLAPSGSRYRNNYMVEGSMTLPWFNRRKHESEISEAQAAIAEQQAEFEATRLTVFQQIQNALVRARAAKRLIDLYRNTLRPQTEATLRSTVIAYENDRTDILNLLDSQNAVLDVDYSYFGALADFEQRMADLELAAGVPIARTRDGAHTEVPR